MHQRLKSLLSGFSESGVTRWISGLVGGVAVLVVVGVLLSGLWTARTAGVINEQQRVQTAGGIAELIAARTDLLLRESDLGTVRRQMIDLQGAGLVRSARVTLSGVGVIASTDPQEIGVMSIPPTWAAARPERASDADGSVLAFFDVPGRGSGTVEVQMHPAPGFASGVLARSGLIALVCVCLVWAVFAKFRGKLSVLVSVGSALREAANGERRADVLRLGAGFGPMGEAWNTLLDERDAQDRALAEQKVAMAVPGASGDSAGVVAVCDALTHGVVIIGPDRQVCYANGAAGVLLGKHREAFGRLEFSAAFQEQSVRDAIVECLESRNPVRRTLELTRGEPGKDPDAELRVSVRSSEAAGARYAGVLIEDITQQRVADRSRNSFVAQATHELRTPLTNIRLYVEQAVDEGEDDPQLRAQALNVINSEARRLERIVSDMLSVAEIEAGSLTIRPGDVRTDALFDDLQHDYAAQAAEKSIELLFDLPPKLPVICGDRDRLGQALHNLVGNALKYTPPGGKVTVRVEAPEEGGLVVHVADTGIGIDPEECERIFERFYRANDRRIAHVTGSGLGLALAREIARLHGGDIEVESKLDHGSTFTIVLPGVDRPHAQRAA